MGLGVGGEFINLVFLLRGVGGGRWVGIVGGVGEEENG